MLIPKLRFPAVVVSKLLTQICISSLLQNPFAALCVIVSVNNDTKCDLSIVFVISILHSTQLAICGCVCVCLLCFANRRNSSLQSRLSIAASRRTTGRCGLRRLLSTLLLKKKFTIITESHSNLGPKRSLTKPTSQHNTLSHP